MSEHRETLRRAEMLQGLTIAGLNDVIRRGRWIHLAAGESLFEAGGPPDAVYVVVDGAVEISRPTADSPEPQVVAYLTPGDTIGEMAYFTGRRRTSSARVPERAELLVLDREAIDTLLETCPELPRWLCEVFARRLEQFIRRERAQPRSKILSGHLANFDLGTVLQTLVQARQTGRLTVVDDEGTAIAEVWLESGLLRSARCDHIDGAEAIFALFQKDPLGKFHFQSSEAVTKSVAECEIDTDAMHLLLEAAHLRDELERVQAAFSHPTTLYQAVEGSLRWTDTSSWVCAEFIHRRLQDPATASELLSEMPMSPARVLTVLEELLTDGQVRVVPASEGTDAAAEVRITPTPAPPREL